MATKARLTPELVVALFTEALTLEIGIRLPVEAAYHDRARTMISTAMKGNPDREQVMVCAFPTDGELWFVKKTVQIEI